MRFVTPESVRIDLKPGPNGEQNWIEVKKELTVGEEKTFRSAGLRNMSQDSGRTQIDVDWRELAMARVTAYLTDWSATRTDSKGKTVPVPVTRESVSELHPEDFEEIDDAIQKHIAEMAPKKTKDVAPSSPATSA